MSQVLPLELTSMKFQEFRKSNFVFVFRIQLPEGLKKHIRKPRPLGGTLRSLFTQRPITHGNMAKTENNLSDRFLMGGVGR